MTEKLQELPILSASDDTKEYQLTTQGFQFRIFSSVTNLSADWESAQPPRNIYLHRPILKTIEEAPPKGIKSCYLVFYKNQQPIGVAYCQILNFKTDENVQDKKGSGAFKALASSVKTFLAKRFEYSLLVCGNLLFTGSHGYYFDKEKVEQKLASHLLNDALLKTQGWWKERSVKTDGIFLKDIDESEAETRQDILDKKYRQFLFHPNMVLNRRPDWKSMDDYLQSISSKYRVRAKKAFKCGKPIEKVILNLEQLKSNVGHLYELYKKVMDTAKFNMVVLHENYIVRLKENLGDRLRVTGYYLDGELIGYRTNILSFDEMEAHFLGYDQSYNKKYKLYLNMLYDSLNQGIEQQVDRVVLARTAMEIKSTIGAVPEELYCYIRANNGLMNYIMPPLLEYFRPEDNWVQRNPFKDNASV